MDQNEYGMIINGDVTYMCIAEQLMESGSILIGWTDEGDAHLNILFTYNIKINCPNPEFVLMQGGITPYYLFVSVIGFSSFGFSIDEDDRAETYISEKLNISSLDRKTAEKLAELINGVTKCIQLGNSQKVDETLSQENDDSLA